MCLSRKPRSSVPQTGLIFDDPSPIPGKIESNWGRQFVFGKGAILAVLAALRKGLPLIAHRDFWKIIFARRRTSPFRRFEGPLRYAHGIRVHTTTELDAAAIHRIGLKEMERIHGEMEKIRKASGFDGDLQAYFEHLRTDPKYVPESKEWLMAEYRKLLEKTDDRALMLIRRGENQLYMTVKRAG